jgi:hypothetical protein
MAEPDVPVGDGTGDPGHPPGPSDLAPAEHIIPVGPQITPLAAEYPGALDMPSGQVHATRVWFGRSDGRLVVHLGDLDESALEE